MKVLAENKNLQSRILWELPEDEKGVSQWNALILSSNQTIMGVEVFHCQGLRWALYGLHMSLSAQVYQLPSNLSSPVRSLKHLIANSVIKESTLSDRSS